MNQKSMTLIKNTANNESQYFKQLSNLPINKLYKVKKFEIIILILNFLSIIFTITIFILNTNNGIESINNIIRITMPIWRGGIRISYYLSWCQLLIILFNLLIRKYMKKMMIVPITKSEYLVEKQIFGDQELISKKTIIENDEINLHEEEDSKAEKEEKGEIEPSKIKKNDENELAAQDKKGEIDPFTEIGIYLRNLNVFKWINLLNSMIIFLYLNYFLKAENLFPSFWQDLEADDTLGFILKPSEFFSYYVLNIIWTLVILLIFIFLLSFNLRQIKDMNTYILKNIEKKSKENGEKLKKKSEKEWKPPLPKKWEDMTLTEKREYNLKALRQKKIYLKQKRMEEFEEIVKREKELLKLGKNRYKKKMKEEKRLKRQTKSKEKKEKKNDEIIKKINEFEKYDFR